MCIYVYIHIHTHICDMIGTRKNTCARHSAHNIAQNPTNRIHRCLKKHQRDECPAQQAYEISIWRNGLRLTCSEHV